MYYVLCPQCNQKVEIPANAVGPDRTDLWNVVSCDECGTGFDYDDEEVIEEPEPPVPG
jgi:transcription elongation factor Elf1